MDERPKVDDRDPADAIDQMVADALAMAETWTAWDGRPIPVATDYGERLYTPHKAIRRFNDHMIDHLAQLQAELIGQPTVADTWQASRFTSTADMAPFTAEDLLEARNRFERLAGMWRATLATIPPDKMDVAKGRDYTPRELAFHTLESMDYANHVGNLWKPRG
ncbi:MAG: hypothetical protein QFC55_05305 [Chloroflexota bacterium]|nr:hypothetical protein [Chloroflexota bacterium]